MLNTKLATTICAAISLLNMATPVGAVPITVEAIGTIYDGYDYDNVLGSGIGPLNGRTVTATWTFDTATVAPDYYMELYPSLRWYNAHFDDWIRNSVLVGGTSVTLHDLAYPSTQDWLAVEDGDISSIDRDAFAVSSGSYSTEVPFDATGQRFDSAAHVIEVQDDLIHGINAGQIFEWTDNDATDVGWGEFELYDDFSSGRGLLVYGHYALHSMTSSMKVPEPTTLPLLGAGLLAMFAWGSTHRRTQDRLRKVEGRWNVVSAAGMLNRKRSFARQACCCSRLDRLI